MRTRKQKDSFSCHGRDACGQRDRCIGARKRRERQWRRCSAGGSSGGATSGSTSGGAHPSATPSTGTTATPGTRSPSTTLTQPCSPSSTTGLGNSTNNPDCRYEPNEQSGRHWLLSSDQCHSQL